MNRKKKGDNEKEKKKENKMGQQTKIKSRTKKKTNFLFRRNDWHFVKMHAIYV